MLITLRHPGPVQAIAPVLPILVQQCEVFVLATDSAARLLFNRYVEYTAKCRIYCRVNHRWVAAHEELLPFLDISEFDTQTDSGYLWLVRSLGEFITQIRPDIILRTTPAVRWGIDEAITDLQDTFGPGCRLLCYQEYYGCGRGLKTFRGTILTLDEDAVQICREQNIISTPVGWLSRLNNKRFPPYLVSRQNVRRQFKLGEEDRALLYCMTASGCFDSEYEIFSAFLRHTKDQKLFVKFHPRTSEAEKDRYLALLRQKKFQSVDSLPYEELLSFPDFIISTASAMNIDSLSYQISCGMEAFQTVSIYTTGNHTKGILSATTGRDSSPPGLAGRGSLIVHESFDSFTFEKPSFCTRKTLREEAERILGGEEKNMIAAFLGQLGLKC